VGNQATSPWTATVTVRWRPTPRAYDARTSLLLSLEEQKRLRAFQLRDDVAHAMLDDDVELAMGISYLSVAFANGVLEGAVLPVLFDSVLDAMKPRISTLNARFQYLCLLPEVSDFEQARKSAAEAVLHSLAAPLKITDFSILMDGVSTDKTEYVAEFGIVNKSEAAARLTQVMGRLNYPDEPDFSHIKWTDRNLPETALYVDSYWKNSEALPSTTSKGLYSRVTNYNKDADDLVRVLLERVSGAELH
jgi:hypothetical protein